MSDNLSSLNDSLYQLEDMCFRTQISIFVFSAICVCNLLLLPVLILVLYLGYRQWRQQKAGSPAAASHSNLFTYHTIAMQLYDLLGICLVFCGSYNNVTDIFGVGLGFLSVTSAGQSLFHLLTCVEHYVAVIHPITYLHLKQAGENRIRHACTGCVWLLSFGWLVLYIKAGQFLKFIFYYCSVPFILIIISFCSFRVLCTLKHPGPSDAGGNRERGDHSKQRAFYTVSIITGLLLFGFVGNLVVNLLCSSEIFSPSSMCVAFMLTHWFTLPSASVLPLLFLHREGKLHCCQNDAELG